MLAWIEKKIFPSLNFISQLIAGHFPDPLPLSAGISKYCLFSGYSRYISMAARICAIWAWHKWGAAPISTGQRTIDHPHTQPSCHAEISFDFYFSFTFTFYIYPHDGLTYALIVVGLLLGGPCPKRKCYSGLPLDCFSQAKLISENS